MPRVIQIPIRGDNSSFGLDSLVQSSGWIGSQNMERGGFDALFDRPFHGPVKNGFIVIVHTEDETRIDHHTEVMKSSNRLCVIPIQVLIFVLLYQIRRVESFKSNKQTPQSAEDRFFE